MLFQIIYLFAYLKLQYDYHLGYPSLLANSINHLSIAF